MRTHAHPLCLSDARVWKRELPIYLSKKWGRSDSTCCRSLCSPDHRETFRVAVQEAVGCSLARTMRAAELQAHRPAAVPVRAGGRTPARLMEKRTALWHPRDAASIYPCVRGCPSAFHAEDKAHPRRARLPVDGGNTNSPNALSAQKDKSSFTFLVCCFFNCFFFRSEDAFH